MALKDKLSPDEIRELLHEFDTLLLGGGGSRGSRQDFLPDYLHLYRPDLHGEVLAQGDFAAWNFAEKRMEATRVTSSDATVTILRVAGTPDVIDLKVPAPPPPPTPAQPKVSYLTTAKNVVRGTATTAYDPSTDLAALKATNGLAAAVTAINALEWVYFVQLVTTGGTGGTTSSIVYCSANPAGMSLYDPTVPSWGTDASGNGGIVLFAAGNLAAYDTNVAQASTPNGSASWKLVNNGGVTASMAVDLIGCRYNA